MISTILSGDLSTDASEEVCDELLVLAAKSGDSLAFVELSKRHSKILLRTIYRIVNSWEDAEDILQDTLMKAFLHIKTFEGRSRVSTWLTRIAINSALMTLRKRRSEVDLMSDARGDEQDKFRGLELCDVRENPEQVYARNERETSLSRAIDRLRPHLRDVVELQRAQEYSAKELAQSLGISVPAVKSRLLRARLALRTSLQGVGGGTHRQRQERPYCAGYNHPSGKGAQRRPGLGIV